MLVTIVLAYLFLYDSSFSRAIWLYANTSTPCRPETRDRTLAEIDELYASGIAKRQWRGKPYLSQRTFIV